MRMGLIWAQTQAQAQELVGAGADSAMTRDPTRHERRGPVLRSADDDAIQSKRAADGLVEGMGVVFDDAAGSGPMRVD